ncbi:helix-turn-helix domain-containing protein [Xanthomonas sacchari]|uniref:helix-turn-helix domain-containing protein n=1 Tax=Xanthomonas sacchari TaxID=56458 RepID=UPI00224F415E|nr:helix-turn-helix domain-containing protein [Xanthomonas sacchari]
MTQLSYDNIFEAMSDDSRESADLQFRAEMIIAIRSYCEHNNLTRAQLAKILCVPQPRVSELMNGKINLISSDKLIDYAAKMGFHFHPVFKPSTSKKQSTIEIEVEEQEVA